MKRSRWLDAVGGVALVALGLGLGAMAGRLGKPPEPSRATIEAFAQASTASVGDAKPSPDRPVSETPAPPSDLAGLPALRQLELLDHRARHGDADAACRLGDTLRSCLVHRKQRNPELSALHLVKLAELPEGQRDRQIEQIVRAQEAWQRMQAHCEGINAEQQLAPMMQHLLQAALAGRGNARHDFVAVRLTLSDLLQQPQLGRLYMQHAPRMFRQMLAEGDPRAIDVLHGFAGVQFPEQRQVAWHAIDDSLRDSDLVRALRILLIERTKPPGVTSHAALSLRAQEPRISAAGWEHAERLWKEHFEGSPAIEALRRREADAHENPDRRHIPESERDRCSDDE
jgi:hypothetical protein